MVVIHPSISKGIIGTQSAEDFGDEGIDGFLLWIEAAKDTILAAHSFSMVFLF